MTPDAPATPATMLRQLTPTAWAQFGTNEIAYIRPVLVDGKPAVAIHAADGTPIGAAPNVIQAVAAIHDHEMEAVLVH